jgi:hypothetical protein
MWSWLSSPPVLLMGLLATILTLVQPLARGMRSFTLRGIVLPPRRRLARDLADLVMFLMQSLPIATEKPPSQDLSSHPLQLPCADDRPSV